MAYEGPHPFPVASGGTGTATLTDHGVLLGSGTGAITAASVGTNGQVLLGATGADAAFATLTSSGGTITFTPGANSLNLEANGGITGPGSSTDNALARWNGIGGDTLQDSTVIVTDNGEMTNASQPAFSAYLGTTDLNVTGDGTTFNLGDTDVGTALTELFDIGGNFTPGASGGAVFTAPVAGIYVFSGGISLLQIGAGHTALDCSFTGSTAGSFFIVGGDVGAMRDLNSQFNFNGSVIMKLAAAETVTFGVTVFSSTKTVDINGVANYKTYFSGYLLG